MKQAIAGVMPADAAESTVMTVWPSIARYPTGQWMGEQFSRDAGVYVFRLGNLIALALIPLGLVMYFYRVLRGSAYQLTNRRIVEMRFVEEVKSVALDGFDTIEIVRLPGQNWYDAGDMLFKLGEIEMFRLEGVARPDSFRQTCLKSRLAFIGVKQALSREAVPV